MSDSRVLRGAPGWVLPTVVGRVPLSAPTAPMRAAPTCLQRGWSLWQRHEFRGSCLLHTSGCLPTRDHMSAGLRTTPGCSCSAWPRLDRSCTGCSAAGRSCSGCSASARSCADWPATGWSCSAT